ncbi:MAG: heparan-alpha-glucosaminide N-acetyltransferase [Pseudomonadota bacterium]
MNLNSPSPAKDADTKGSRIAVIDTARGVALIAMTIYHFTWDLEFFGWLLPATATTTPLLEFARAIAFSFLFLVGISLVLAHQKRNDDGSLIIQIRWRAFWIRFVQIAAAAAIITTVTWLAFPGGTIFFGILHAIALFSLVGLLFLRLRWFVTLCAAIAVFAIGQTFSHDIFTHPAFFWAGLATTPPVSNDYVPMFPWMAATLLGIALAQLLTQLESWSSLARFTLPQAVERPLHFISRHSLVYYLIHQPIMIGILWCVVAIGFGPDRTSTFLHSCNQQCVPSRSAAFCNSYCSCMANGLKDMKQFTPFMDGEFNISEDQRGQDLILQCIAEAE